MLELNDKLKNHLSNVFNYLKQEFPDAELFLFGSIVSRGNKPFHDIDIGIEDNQKIPLIKLQRVKEKIEDLNIPYKVDIIDFKRVPESFYKIAKSKIIRWIC